MLRWTGAMVAVLLGLASASMVRAQDYPARPITMIVPFPAGGATDTPEALRAFQKAETERWWLIIRAANLKAE